MLRVLLPDAGSAKTNNENQCQQWKSVVKHNARGEWRGNSFNETGHDSLREADSNGECGADASKSSQHRTMVKNKSHKPLADNEIVFYCTYKNTPNFFWDNKQMVALCSEANGKGYLV